MYSTRMQLVSESFGFAFERPSMVPLRSLSPIATVPVVNELPVFAVVDVKAA